MKSRKIFLSTNQRWVGLGLGRDEAAAREDALTNLIGITRESFLIREGDHHATILFHHKTLRASNPPPKVPEAK